MNGFTAQQVPLVDGSTLNALSRGSHSPCMVLLHGLGDFAAVWSPFVRALQWKSGIVAMDLPGHGDSCSLGGQGYSVSDVARRIAEALRCLRVRSPILVGHSFGAQVAIHLAASSSLETTALVLVDGGPFMSATAAPSIRRELVASYRRFAAPEEYGAVLRARLPLADPALLEELAAFGLRRVSSDALEPKCRVEVLDSLAFSSDDELVACLAGVSAPTLVVRGAWSSVLSPAGARTILRSTPGGQYAEVAGAGHCVPLDNPAELAAVVEGFLEQSVNAVGCRRQH